MDKKLQGKRNRESGQRFELKVRKNLESKDWIVDRWSNNVSDFPDENINLSPEERKDRKLIPAKSTRFNRGTTGFPDFIAFTNRMGFRTDTLETINQISDAPERYYVIGVECKSNGYLTEEEREKCKWYLENNIFSKILIARKGKKRGEIEYIEFK